jgi:hypothetical protein
MSTSELTFFMVNTLKPRIAMMTRNPVIAKAEELHIVVS